MDLTRSFDEETLAAGPPDPQPRFIRDMGPVLARWPMILQYDADSGELWRRYILRARSSFPETLEKHEYLASRPRDLGNFVKIDGFTVPAARLVWLFHHGEWPPSPVQRMDGDCFNDRIENLFLRSQPPKGAPGRPRFRPPGVSRFYDRWTAYGDLGQGRRKYLGRFQTIEEAVLARKAWDDANDLV